MALTKIKKQLIDLLSPPLPSVSGGTGLSSPGTEGNVLTSDGTTWISNPLPFIGVGINQTWQDVTSSRILGTTYTNNTGKPIMLIGEAWRNAVSTAGLSVTINGLTVPLCYSTNSNGGNRAVGSIIIPVNATYIINQNSETIAGYYIYELR